MERWNIHFKRFTSLTFASVDRIHGHHDLLKKFVCEVLDIPDGAVIMVSDETIVDIFDEIKAQGSSGSS